MDLRNWETFVLTGAPVVGATVEVREAVLTHPNVGTILASSVTDLNGMWEFLGLSDTPKDVKVIYLGKTKWLKGLTKHSIDLAQGSDFVPANQNILRNGGLETWKRGDLTNIVLGANADAPTAVGWNGRTGTGDTMTVTREGTIIVPESQYSAKIVYDKGSGIGYFDQILPPPLVYAMRNKQITLSCQVRQGVASNVVAHITNSTSEIVGSAVATTGSFVTLSATRTPGVGQTSMRVGIKILADDTVYLDNVMLTFGPVVPVFTPRANGQETGQQDYAMQDRRYAQIMLFRS